MNLLLDTHIALWAVANNPRLPAAAKAAISEPASDITVSVASLWEIAIKHANDKDQGLMPVSALEAHEAFTCAGFRILSVAASHALALEALPPIHKDPFDRILAAQARAEGMTLLTADAVLARYPGDVRKV